MQGPEVANLSLASWYSKGVKVVLFELHSTHATVPSCVPHVQCDKPLVNEATPRPRSQLPVPPSLAGHPKEMPKNHRWALVGRRII